MTILQLSALASDSPLTITLDLFIFTLRPLNFTLSFHWLSLLIRSPSVSAITTKSSAYNSHGNAMKFHTYLAQFSKSDTGHKLWLPWQSQITMDSMLNLGAYKLLPQNIYCYHKLFLQLFLHLCTWTWLPILGIPNSQWILKNKTNKPTQDTNVNKQQH